MTFAAQAATASLSLPGVIQDAIVAKPDVALVEGARGLEALEAEWRALAAVAPDRAAFLSYGFAHAAALYHESRGERVLTARVDLDGRARCLLPVAITRRSGLRVAALLGDPVTQYGDALLAADAPRDLPEVALGALTKGGAADVFSLRRIRADAALRGAVARFARPVGPATPSPFADMTESGSADDLMLAIGGAKQRRERQRSRRRLAECGDLKFEARTGQDALVWLGEAFSLKRVRLAQAGHASPVIDDPETVTLFERVARDPLEGDAVIVSRLTVGGEPAAYEIGLARGARYHAFLGVTVDGYPNASPGKIVMEETLRWCAAEGLNVFDLLPSPDAYKRHWSNGVVEVQDYIAATTIVGAIYADAWLGIVRPRLRAGLDLLPAGLRRRVGGAAMRVGVR